MSHEYLPGGWHHDFRRSDEPFPHPFGGGLVLWGARLNSSWVSNAADADILMIDGATLTDTGVDATVYDPLGIFSVLGVDDELLVIKQRGKYYAIQAACPS